MGIWADFKKFAGNRTLVNMAIGIVVGIAITTVVTGLVGSVVNPAIGIVFHRNLDDVGNVTISGSTFTFGILLSDAINFVAVLAVVFMILAYPMIRVERRRAARQPPAAVTNRDCPECYSSISRKAKRCAFCGSAVEPLDPA